MASETIFDEHYALFYFIFFKIIYANVAGYLS